ncbi:MAG: hypothetical protein AB7O96_12650 [Pseudobdellovibrionaceae bacterium]
MLKMVLLTAVCFMAAQSANVANAGCMPCGDRKFCCSEETCRKCNEEAGEESAYQIRVLSEDFATPVGGVHCKKCPSESENCLPLPDCGK